MTPGSEPIGGDIQAVARCAAILTAIADREAVRPADIAAELNLDRSTAHRYLTSMERARLVERRGDGSFAPGPLVIQVGAVALQRSRVVEYATPFLAELSAAVHQTVVLSMWGGRSPVVARVFEDSDRLVHVSVREGSRLPLRAAQSVIFLAHLADRELVDALLSELSELTRREVAAAMEHVLTEGFAENTIVAEGIRTVATPIFDSLGEIRATVAFVGTAESIPPNPESGTVRSLIATATEISHRLGYQEGPAKDTTEMVGSA